MLEGKLYIVGMAKLNLLVQEDVAERNAVLRISQFVLNRSTDDIRKELHEFMVQTVLAKNRGKRGLPKSR
ncbi:MAG: hypothetical protein QXR44_05480 [Thermoproteota archaeon]